MKVEIENEAITNQFDSCDDRRCTYSTYQEDAVIPGLCHISKNTENTKRPTTTTNLTSVCYLKVSKLPAQGQ